MAILPLCPKIYVCIGSQGAYFRELLDEGQDRLCEDLERAFIPECIRQRTSSHYIEAVPGTGFDIILTVQGDWTYRCCALGFEVLVDGKFIENTICLRHHFVNGIWQYVIPKPSPTTLAGVSLLERFNFYGGTLVDDRKTYGVQEDAKRILDVGSIVVKVHRMGTGNFFGGHGHLNIPRTLYDAVPIDGPLYPLGVFRFKYRSKEALQSLSIKLCPKGPLNIVITPDNRSGALAMIPPNRVKPSWPSVTTSNPLDTLSRGQIETFAGEQVAENVLSSLTLEELERLASVEAITTLPANLRIQQLKLIASTRYVAAFPYEEVRRLANERLRREVGTKTWLTAASNGSGQGCSDPNLAGSPKSTAASQSDLHWPLTFDSDGGSSLPIYRPPKAAFEVYASLEDTSHRAAPNEVAAPSTKNKEPAPSLMPMQMISALKMSAATEKRRRIVKITRALRKSFGFNRNLPGITMETIYEYAGRSELPHDYSKLQIIDACESIMKREGDWWIVGGLRTLDREQARLRLSQPPESLEAQSAEDESSKCSQVHVRKEPPLKTAVTTKTAQINVAVQLLDLWFKYKYSPNGITIEYLYEDLARDDKTSKQPFIFDNEVIVEACRKLMTTEGFPESIIVGGLQAVNKEAERLRWSRSEKQVGATSTDDLGKVPVEKESRETFVSPFLLGISGNARRGPKHNLEDASDSENADRPYEVPKKRRGSKMIDLTNED